MLFLFRHDGRKYAFDTAGGVIFPLCTMEYKMLEAAEPPLTPTLPTALRYELAKFDSEEVGSCYARLYEKYRDGVIFRQDGGCIAFPPDADPALCNAAAHAAAENAAEPWTETKNCPEHIRAFLKEQGKLA